MIFILPEVIYQDDEKEKQVFEDELKPVFSINIIQKFFRKKLSKYSDKFYQNATKAFFANFPKEVYTINEFILGKVVKVKEEPIYIIDDTEEEPIIPDEEEEDEDAKSLDLGDIRKWWKKLKKAYKWVRKTWRKIKAYKRLLRRKWKRLKKLFSKHWKKAKKLFSRCKTRFLKWYKKVLKPFLKKMKTRFIRFCKRLFKKLKKVTKKVSGKFLKILRVAFKRLFKKAFKKLLKKSIQKAIRIAITTLIKLLAGGLTATGIGSVIGVPLFIAMTAWDVYDIAKDSIQPEPDESEGGEEIEQVKAKAEQETALKAVEVDVPMPDITIKNVTNTVAEVQTITYRDEISKALYNSSSYPIQIIGRFYDFYHNCYDWLLAQEYFVLHVFEKLSKQLVKTFEEISSWLDEIHDPTPVFNMKLHPEDGPKQFPELNQDKMIKIANSFKNRSVFTKLWSLIYNIKVNNISKSETKGINSFRDWFKVKHMRNSLNFLSKKQNIEPVAEYPGIKNEKIDLYFYPYNNIEQEKLDQMLLKNHLLYNLYSMFSWVLESAEKEQV